MSSIFNSIRTLNNAVIGGDLIVKGTTTSVDSEVVNIADNHLFLNKDYTTSGAAQTGGLVVNYDPQETAAATAFTAADTITTDNSIVAYTAGDFVQITGSDNGENDGIYEVSAYVNPTLTIKTSPLVPFVKNAVVTETGSSATVSRVALSVIQCNSTTGEWEQAAGTTTTGLTFTSLGSSDHGGLNGLTDDDHTQYALLAGRTGGQTLIGSDTATQNLTLTPNSGATDGAVIIASSTTNATDKDTGALIVAAGGLGVELNVHAGGSITTETGFIGSSVDTAAAGTLTIGPATATLVEIADVGVITNVQGSLTVDETTTLNNKLLIPWAADASTTAQTPTIAQLNAATRFTGTSDFTYTLPLVDTTEDGMQLSFMKTGASGTVTLAANAGNVGLIEGGTIDLTDQYDRLTIMFSDVDDRWIII